jgi:glycosyltransferase involved in cell wall biosynthesis
MHSDMVWVFWSAAAFLAYTFAGYPFLLWFTSLWHDRPHRRAAIEPEISLIVAAHNEAPAIRKKILNCLALVYPKDKYEIIVVSDGSDDATAEITRSFDSQGVKLLEIRERRGKQYAQMLARDASHGEILVFTDAGVELKPDGLQKIVSNFADPSVGCVSSEDEVVQGKKGKIGEGSYVQLEMWLRRLESRIGSVVTASGSFFAARRSACEVWHTDQTSDFFIVLNVLAMDMRAIVDPECVGSYALVHTDRAELQRKIRTIVNGLYVFSRHLRLLNPLRYGLFSWQLVSHKLFRWLTPFAILALLISSGYLWQESSFYRICFVLQIGVYGIGLCAVVAGQLIKAKPVKLAGYFLLGNVATLMAWVYFLAGEKFVTWQPTRRS